MSPLHPRAVLALVLVLCLSGCAADDVPTDPGEDPAPPPPSPAIVTSIEVAPATDTLEAVEHTTRFQATARDSTGAVVQGASLSWSSSRPEVAEVDEEGVVTARGAGSASITATRNGAKGTATVAVAQVPTDLSVAPTDTTLDALGSSAALRASVLDAEGHPVPGLPEPSWSSSDTAVVSVSAEGVALAVSEGDVAVTATLGDFTSAVPITVAQRPAVLDAAADAVRLEPGDRRRLDAAVMDANGHPVATTSLSWSTDDDAVASVDDEGIVAAEGVGSTWIRVSVGALHDSVQVDVEEPEVPEPSLRASPGTLRFDSFGEQAHISTRYDDGTGAEREVRAAWVTRDRDVARVADGHPEGFVQSVGDGATWLVASYQGTTDSVRVQVERIPRFLNVRPGSVSVGVGGFFEAEAVSVDDVGTVVVHPAEWVSRDPGIATVASGSDTGRVEAVAPGVTWVVAEAVGLRDSLRVRVVERPTEAEEDVVIATEADMDAWSALTRLDGSLVVSGSDLVELDGLPHLREVTGNVTIRGNARLSVVDLPALTTGGIVFEDNPALVAARFPSLRTPGTVSVGGSPAMTELSLPAVEFVHRYSLSGLALERVVVPPLFDAAPHEPPLGDIRLENMSDLRDLVVQAVEVETLILQNNPRLESVSLPRLERLVGRGLTVRDLASLRSLEAPELQSTLGIRIQRNPALEAIRLPKLQTNPGIFVLSGHPALENVHFPRLYRTDSILIGDNPLLEDLSFLSGLTSPLGVLWILRQAGLTDISALSGLGDAAGRDPIIEDPVRIEDNPSLPTSQVQGLLDALEAKFDGDAFPGGVTVSGNGGG